MIDLDIVERLRGKVRVPVNDGAGLLDGKDFFERTFPTSRAALEAADEIESRRRRVAALELIISQDLHPDDCSDECNRMIVEEIHAFKKKSASPTPSAVTE